MKIRDILILLSLVVLILVLTIMEKYADRQRESRQLDQIAESQLRWRQEALQEFERRWDDLSAELRGTLDSIAGSVIREGVTAESLAVVVMDQPPTPVPDDSVETAPSRSDDAIETPSAPRPDTLAQTVAAAYESALAALPEDLNTYEQRVATNEVASLLRARFGVSRAQFDSLLKAAND